MSEREAGPWRVLVIDDDTTNLQLARTVLAPYGWQILTARDGESGVRRARLAQPEVILLDIQMPGIDGYEACRRLKASPETRDIPVIFTTAFGQPAHIIRAFELGGVDYVTKPFVPEVLVARVRAHLELHVQRRQLAGRARSLHARTEAAARDLRREQARLDAALTEKGALAQAVRQLGDQSGRLTEGLLAQSAGSDRTLARSLGRELLTRLRLVDGELAQAAESPVGGAQEHVDRARALLAPILEEATSSPEAVGSLASNPLPQLSDRERAVFRLLVEGLSIKEIGAELGVKATTVSTYRRRILDKLEVEDLAALVRLSVAFPLPPD